MTISHAVCGFGAECLVEEGLEQVLRLAQRLALHRAQPLVPRHQRGELLLQRKGRNGNTQSFYVAKIDALNRTPCKLCHDLLHALSAKTAHEVMRT